MPNLAVGGALSGALVVVSLVTAPIGSAVEGTIDTPARSTSLTRATRVSPPTRPGPIPEPTTSTEIDALIRIDQFGYLPRMPKVAVITGDAGGTAYEVRSTTGGVVFEGRSTAWAGGALDAQSQDRGAQFDFSAVTAAGSYEVVDVDRDRSSGVFRIGIDVYDDVLDAAMKVFWFNRGNVAHQGPLAGPWSQSAAVIRPGQDTEARWVDARDDASTARDLSGGWFDAGDTNKYVTFAVSPVHQLLDLSDTYAEIFDDAAGLPESGNGVADILDEVHVELEWLEKMQDDDGGVLVKVGFLDYEENGPIELDARPRYYEEACSSSTIAAAGMYAHGALRFRSVDRAFADRLQERAEDAWDWYSTNERSAECDSQIVKAGDADKTLVEQDRLQVGAAIHLFALTGAPWYHDIVIQYVDELAPFADRSLGRYDPQDAIALVRYRNLPNADAATVSQIDELLEQMPAAPDTAGFDSSQSLYRSYLPDAQYHWGSNMVMANTGHSNFEIIRTGIAPSEAAGLAERGAAHLHTLHGVNPMGITYLSNMGDFGAERSVDEIYHYWFADGSRFDSASTSSIGPAPGYVPGGPNAGYSGQQSPPAGQPISKSWFDWNTPSDFDRPWEITEPAIYYQSAYVALLAAAIGYYS